MGSTMLAHTGTRCSISDLALILSRLIRTRLHPSHRRGDELIRNWNASWNVSENLMDLVCVSVTHCPRSSGKLRERRPTNSPQWEVSWWDVCPSCLFAPIKLLIVQSLLLAPGIVSQTYLSAFHFTSNQPKTLMEWSKNIMLDKKKVIISKCSFNEKMLLSCDRTAAIATSALICLAAAVACNSW